MSFKTKEPIWKLIIALVKKKLFYDSKPAELLLFVFQNFFMILLVRKLLKL